MELSRLIGRAVVDRDGHRVGAVTDLCVRLADPAPVVTRVVVRTSRRTTADVEWSDVRAVDEDRVELGAAGIVARPRRGDDELLLRRDVLDTQVLDLAGKRLARVADVRLAQANGFLEAVGVEVGLGAMLRRIGLRRLAQRFPENPIAWSAVHLASVRGHALQLTTPAAQRLSPADLAELLGHLPTGRGADLLEGLPAGVAADALSRARPGLGGRLVRSIAPHRAAPIIGAMPSDDATAALRHLPPQELDALFAELDSQRVGELRRLLAHPARTAGGLMNPEVIRAREDEPIDVIRARVVANPPRLDALLTVVIVDDDDRPVGVLPPLALLAGDARPEPARPVAEDAAVARVIDIFALHDVLAVPVVGPDGRLRGVIAVDDVLEELLVERLPGRRRFHSLRGWRR